MINPSAPRDPSGPGRGPSFHEARGSSVAAPPCRGQWPIRAGRRSPTPWGLAGATLVAAWIALPWSALAGPPTNDPKDPVLQALSAEVQRLTAQFATMEPRPYYLALGVTEAERELIVGEEGALQGEAPSKGRWLSVDLRFGTPELDSTHPLRDGSVDDGGGGGRPFPLGDDVRVLRRIVSLEVEQELREARERYERVLADRQVRVEEAKSLDFAPAPAVREILPTANLSALDRKVWRDTIRRASAAFAETGETLDPNVTLSAEAETRWYVDSAGTALREGATRYRVSIVADLLAADGTQVHHFQAFDAATPDGLPRPEALVAEAQEAVARVRTLREAPEQEPYSGPAILSGRASAVFFHEIFGHRVEGQRLKQIADAQTFRTLVGQKILPDFISVADDPSLTRLHGVDLRGHYRFDDEGVRGERVALVDGGTMLGFLESRSPVGTAGKSNGHGRRQPGQRAVARQGNLVVTARDSVDEHTLRERLLIAAKDAGLPYALWIDDIDGGYTFTERDIPNAFQVNVTRARRIWVDGRPDEVVRGIDLIGTPLQTFARIVAAGTQVEVFNGSCGAESGWVPVSAAAPALLVSTIETQRKGKGQERPPLLPPPVAESAEGDVLLAAMVAEAERAARELTLPGAPGPAWVTVGVRDEDVFHVAANFGTLEVERSSRGRPTAVEVVVGDTTLNSGRLAQTGGAAVPAAIQRPRLVIEDLAGPIRRDLWLSADGSYKAALGRILLKIAARKNAGGAAPPPDWTDAPPVVALDGSAPPAIQRDRLRELARRASSRLRGLGELRHGQVVAGSDQGRVRLVDTRGTRVVQPDGQSVVYAWADLVRPDGVRVFDRLQWVARSDAELPPVEEVSAAVEAMGRSVLARGQAAAHDFYEGPVVFEGEAASDLFRYLVPPALLGTPPEPDPSASWQEQNRRGPRIGRRLLPAGWSVRDDPTSIPAGGLGLYLADAQGVKPRPVTLVEDGYVRDLLMTRVPRPELQGSTGHARGGFGTEAEARFTAWTVDAPAPLADEAFDKQAESLARAAQLERWLVVRRMEQGWEGSLPRPTDAVWRYVDGREEPVLLLEFQGVDRDVLRDIVAHSGAPRVHRYLAPGGAWERAGTMAGLPTTLRAPGRVLVDLMELQFPGAQEPPPLLPLPSWEEQGTVPAPTPEKKNPRKKARGRG